MGLFQGEFASREGSNRRAAALNEIERWGADDFLAQDIETLCAHLLSKHEIRSATLRWAEAFSPGGVTETVVGVKDGFGYVRRTHGRQLEISVPVDGDPAVFNLRGSAASPGTPTSGQIRGGCVTFTVGGLTLSEGDVLAQFEREKTIFERYARATLDEANGANAQLAQAIRTSVEARRQRLLEDRKLTASLPFPVRPVTDASSYPIAIHRQVVALPQKASRVGFEPEPELEEKYYEQILTQCMGWARTLERIPDTTTKLDEEGLRDILLSILNSNWEGQAGGEIFNGAGKTDILVREKDRNVFIGECKYWKGQASAGRALDQLLGYLVWRDTKAALLVFITNKDVTRVLQALHEAVETHPQWVRSVTPDDPDHRRDYVFHATDDEQRLIKLAVLPVIVRGD